jgi:hypothetical protein
MSRQSVESHRATSTSGPSHTSDTEIGNNKENTIGGSSARDPKVVRILSKNTRCLSSIFLWLCVCIFFTFASYYAPSARCSESCSWGHPLGTSFGDQPSLSNHTLHTVASAIGKLDTFSLESALPRERCSHAHISGAR